jgi:hypothetical protein
MRPNAPESGSERASLEQRARGRRAEAPSQHGGGPQRPAGEAGGGDGLARVERNAERADEVVEDDAPVTDDGARQTEICPGVSAEPLRRDFRIAHDDGGALRQRVRDLHFRLDHRSPCRANGSRAKKGEPAPSGKTALHTS